MTNLCGTYPPEDAGIWEINACVNVLLFFNMLFPTIFNPLNPYSGQGKPLYFVFKHVIAQNLLLIKKYNQFAIAPIYSTSVRKYQCSDGPPGCFSSFLPPSFPGFFSYGDLEVYVTMCFSSLRLRKPPLQSFFFDHRNPG